MRSILSLIRKEDKLPDASQVDHPGGHGLVQAVAQFAAMPESRGPMKMPKPSEKSKAAFSKLVPDAPGVTLRPMFGQLSAFVNGNMFSFIWGDELLVRLPDSDIAALKKQGGKDFSPMAGRTGMAGYVTVPGDWLAKPPTTLVKRALEFTGKMPAKKPKAPKAAKKAAKKA